MIEPDEIVAGNISIYRNALAHPMKTIEILERAAKQDERFKWDHATIHRGEISNYRSNDSVFMSRVREFPPEELPELAAEDRRVFNAIEARVTSYASSNGMLIEADEGWQVLRYHPGTEYKVHQDYHKDNQRIMSSILYLNDDFVGGETEFVKFGVAVKPEAGMLVLFPANYAYAHVAKPLLRGTKYAIVSWFRD